ncbi:hypothetical protein JCM10207_003048 [Rhodosporidiobolus poonsookiae]
MGDGTSVRRLPPTPGHLAQPVALHPSRAASSTSLSSLSSFSHSADIDDPFQASSSGAAPASSMFSPSYSIAPHPPATLSRVESHPLSLAPSSLAGRSSAEFAAEPAFGSSRRLSSSDDEELEARSPLQPSHSFGPRSSSVSPHRQRPSQPGSAKRSPFLAPLSIPKRLSPGGSPSNLGPGWRELSPSRSPGGAEEGRQKSPLARRGTLSAVAGGLRRMSVRVVNVTGTSAGDEDEAEQDQLRASTSGVQRSPSGAGASRARRRSSVPVTAAAGATLAERRASRLTVPGSHEGAVSEEEEEGEDGTPQEEKGGLEEEAGDDSPQEPWEAQHAKSERAYRQLRGKTLGLFGPDNPLRRACARVLTAQWTEPTILVLIILQVVVLTIQSSYNVYDHPRPTKGYFHAWEDVVLFAIFVCFTVEIVARIVVTGLIFNPPKPPTPPAPKVNLYGSNTPKRSPSIVTRIQSRLSPANSPLPSPTGMRHPPLPSPTRLSPLPPSPSHLYPVPLSPVKDHGTYPPSRLPADGGAGDLSTVPYSRYDDPATASSTALVRDNSHAPYQPSTPRKPRLQEALGIGLGFSHAPVTPDGAAVADSNTFSIRAALASNLPAAAGAASATSTAAAASNRNSGYYSSTPYALSIKRQRESYQQAFLRHSWNRIDAVAVVCYWISFALAVKGWEAERNLWFFRSLSVLRATRLLAVTAGTQTILQSLKRASPLLVDVGIFVAFAIILFSIIGVQAFRGSYKRTCQWIDPTGVFENVTAADQHCGGYVDPDTGDQLGYLLANYQPSGDDPKGFICGVPSVCVETSNPANGVWSFDNIFAAILQVVVVASANTWTDSMYAMMDSDYFVSCLFFIFCLLIVNYWLFSLFVACITSTFADIRDETKHSAFATTSVVPAKITFDDHLKPHRALTRTTSFVRTVYEKTAFVWIFAIVASVAIQAAREYGTSRATAKAFQLTELGLTIAFDVEIAIRLFASLPDWRDFFAGRANLVDTFLAVVDTVLQIPVVRDSRAYPWLTCFQIARFYRVILFIPRMRRLLHRVLGTFTALINMITFLLMMNFIAALIAVQFLRGIPDPDNDDTGLLDFYQIYNAFVAMYQILSSENWTDVLKTGLANETGQFQIVLCAVFLAGWMLFSFFILGNMFIAVINENFAIAEEEKRVRQAEAFVSGVVPGKTATAKWFRRFDPYTYVSKRRATNVTDTTIVDEPEEVPDRMMTASPEMMDEPSPDEKEHPKSAGASSTRFLEKAKHSLRFQSGIDSVVNYMDPRTPQIPSRSYRDPRTGTIRSREATLEEQGRVREVAEERRNAIAEFIAEHPTYDKTLFLFSQSSSIRRFCQSVVEPSYGHERINGQAPSPNRKRVFSAIVFAAIVSSIAIAGYATPLYRRDYYLKNGDVRWTWFNLVEASLGAIFFAEALVKWIADGFLLGPNAYLLSLWNDIDFFVLVTLVINITTSLIGGTSSSRFTRALKAFRALRLINLSTTIRTTFYNVLIVGFGRIMDASFLAALYILPFAVWAQNVFSGLLYSCSDSSVTTKFECAGEYMAETIDGWSYLAPRVWQNPSYWDFDSFRASLLILFEIISLEGWIDVMESVMQITGQDRQPQTNASQWNALFFIGYNLIGATFILTLFVSLIILNFAERTSTSLLTTEQRQWLDLRRYISSQQPARRPKHRPTSAFRSWCFDRAVHKRGWWSRGVTGLYLVNIVVLMTQAETTSAADDARNYIFLGFTVLYAIDILVRIAGLGHSFFKSYWNLYDLFVVSGTIATTLPLLAGNNDQVVVQLQKLFLVSIVFKLAQRNDSLNQLFKTAAASLPAILNIFALWLILFLVFAIFYIELFGLTRWGSAGTHNSNYYTFFNTLVLLALQSTGEGWNEYAMNYTVEFPACTNSLNYLFSDCGSAPGAYSLFIIWNVLSMYLFVNLILGAVIENFSFVFQTYVKVTSITREQMRGFKKVWAQFDTERTGYLQPKDVPRFLHRLSGIFETKIYRDEWSVPTLQASAARDVTAAHTSPAFYHYLTPRDALSLERLDLDTLRALVDGIDADEVHQRRDIYLHVYHEAMMLAEETLKGISFQKMLTLLAHYRLIDDDSALQMDELVARRQVHQRVAHRVDLDRVHAFLRMVVLRRRFLQRRNAASSSAGGAVGVPTIQVEQSLSPRVGAHEAGDEIEEVGGDKRRARQRGRGGEAAGRPAGAGRRARPSVSFAEGETIH